MTQMVLGTGICADFPTLDGNIYPREVLESLVNNPKLKQSIKEGKLIGGVLSNNKLIDNTVTHHVTDIRLFNDELVIEVETKDDDIAAKLLLAPLSEPEAAVVIATPNKLGRGETVREIQWVESIHIRERRKC
jgi:hypothetical protein